MQRASKPFDANDPIWKLTPFIDFPNPGPFTYDFRWEREWRGAHDVRFSEEDVAFLLLPEQQHAPAWGFFDDAPHHKLRPGSLCPHTHPPLTFQKGPEALDKSQTPEL